MGGKMNGHRLAKLMFGAGAMGGGKAAISILLSKFKPTVSDVGLNRDSNTGDYYIHQAIGGGYYWTLYFHSSANPGACTEHVIYGNYFSTLIIGVDQEDASVARTGAGWGSRSVAAAAYGGDYRKTTTTGDWTRWTTPDGVTRVGAWFEAGSNAGLVKVVVDSDPTAATSLMTAQQYVDAAIFPNTILVANGGNLNPTDRCYDQFVNVYGTEVELAAGLTAGIHTVDLYCTGYKRAASTDVRLYSAGFWYNAPAGSNLATPHVMVHRDVTIMTNNQSVYEYALAFTCAGGADSVTFSGNGHGYDNQTGLVIKVAGSVVTPSEYQVLQGAVEITRTSELRHYETGATKKADVTTVYSMSATTGLTVSWTLTWAADVTVTVAYPCMYAANEYLDKGSMIGATTDYTLTSNTGSYRGNVYSQAAYLWDANGTDAVMAYIANLAQSCPTPNGSDTMIEDRAGGVINKIYFTRDNRTITEDMLANSVLQSVNNYKAMRFVDANAALAR
jgi:hypothetical protein